MSYRSKFFSAAAVMLGLSPLVVNASDQIPGAPQSTPIVLTGGTLHPVSGEAFQGELLFAEGRIVALGERVERPTDATVVDISGKHVYPGFISAETVMGLVEISAVRATNDISEVGDIKPNVQAEVAVNPDSEIIPVTRASGILTVLTAPRGGLVSGTSAVINLDGWTWEQMTVKAPAGMHVNWPRMMVSGGFGSPDPSQLASSAAESIASLGQAFATARAYVAARDAGQVDTDLRWEAMRPVLAGDVPLFVHANTQAQLKSAVAFAAEQGVELVVVGGDDAWRVADLLAAEGVSVVTDVHDQPLRRWEDYDTAFTNPAKLADAGVRFAFGSGGSGFAVAHERNLPFQAGTAVGHGLDRDHAIRALTLDAAEILGVADRLGSLDAGKDATLIVVDGDPLEVMSSVDMAWIQGREVDLSSRHTMLYEKYQQKYQQLEGGADR